MKMFPATYNSVLHKSSAERKMFDKIENSEIQGTCFHSLRLREHEKSPTSEADFVIVTKEALLVIEVKGGGIIHDSEGWYYQGNKGLSDRDERGPFLQAEQAMRALVKILNDDHPGLLHDLAWHWAVSFPDDDTFTETSSEWEQWQIHNKQHMGQGKTEKWLSTALTNTRKKHGRSTITKERYEQIVNAIRPEFNHANNYRSLGEEAGEQIIRLTNQQLGTIRLLENADRSVIRGPAGTGKTVMAVEEAKSRAADGSTVIILCPSEGLAKHLHLQTTGENIDIQVATETEREVDQKYDWLIIDEAQDMMDDSIYERIEMYLEGGVSNGKWRIFLDDCAQAQLAKNFDREVLEILDQYASYSPPALDTNCRNTKQVITTVNGYTGADIGVPTVFFGHYPKEHFFKNQDHAIELIEKYLGEWIDGDVDPRSITFLSPYPDDSSVWEIKKRFRRKLIRFGAGQLGEDRENLITVASPREFKGLENDYIFLVDFETFSEAGEHMAELYVGMTRAKYSFTLLMAESQKEKVKTFYREAQFRSGKSE